MISSENKRLFPASGTVLVAFLVTVAINANTDSLKPFPLDLSDVGFQGSWEQFCDKEDIWKEFREFPEHDLPRMRTTICTLRESGKGLTEVELQAIVAYKYCTTMQRPFRDLLTNFTDKLSLGSLEQRNFLLNPRIKANNGTACYNETLSVFYETCAGEHNPCINMFKLILARACVAFWLKNRNITSYIHETCDGKWISDDINWEVISRSMKYVQ